MIQGGFNQFPQEKACFAKRDGCLDCRMQEATAIGAGLSACLMHKQRAELAGAQARKHAGSSQAGEHLK